MTTVQRKRIRLLILALRYVGGHFTLDTDVCNEYVGWLLSQDLPITEKTYIGF